MAWHWWIVSASRRECSGVAPSIDEGDITDKGYINQGAVRQTAPTASSPQLMLAAKFVLSRIPLITMLFGRDTGEPLREQLPV